MSCGTETETVSRMEKAAAFDFRLSLQPSVSGTAISVRVSGLTVDILSADCDVFTLQCAKL